MLLLLQYLSIYCCKVASRRSRRGSWVPTRAAAWVGPVMHGVYLCCPIPNCHPSPLGWVHTHPTLLRLLCFSISAALPGKSEISVPAEHDAEDLQVKTAKWAVEGGKWLLFKFLFLITSMLSSNLEAGSPLSLPAHQLFFLLPTKANPAGTREASGLISSVVVLLFPEKGSVCVTTVWLWITVCIFDCTSCIGVNLSMDLEHCEWAASALLHDRHFVGHYSKRHLPVTFNSLRNSLFIPQSTVYS